MSSYNKNDLDELAIKTGFLRDYLLPVLRKSEKFDFNAAKDEVIKFLNDFLVFSADERLFIEHFNHRNYRPEILFKDSHIVERISNHPMALWKCRPFED